MIRSMYGHQAIMQKGKIFLKSGFVSIIGRPNVGKSTLVNAIVGEKVAIVSNKPQTTRQRLQGIYTSENGQIVFLDTPGIHKPHHRLGEYMVDVSTRSLEEGDLIYYLVDATKPFGSGEQFIIDQLQNVKVPVFLVVNKVDLLDKEELDRVISSYTRHFQCKEVIPVSALNHTNLEKLLHDTFACLSKGPLYYPEDHYTDQPMSFLSAEIIREKTLQLTRDEVPHSVAVKVEDFCEQGENRWYIRATIYTERDSQKGIIIGRNGQMLKKIGELARKDIETIMGAKVYLDLWIKVRKNWRDNEANLKQLGFSLEDR